MTLIDTVISLEGSQGHLLDRPHVIRGKLGMPDASGNHRVLTGQTGYHWVRLHGSYNYGVQAYNAKTSATYDLEVYVTVDPYRSGGVAPYVVLGTVASASTVMGPLLSEKSQAEEINGPHASAHEFSDMQVGRDALNIFARAIVPLRAQESSSNAMQVFINPGYYMYSGENVLFKGATTSVIPVPVLGTRSDLIYLDCRNNSIGMRQGAVASTVYDAMAVPETPAGSIALAYVTLKPTTTSIEEQNIYDLRPIITRNSKELVVDMYGDALVDNTGSRLYA